MCFGRSPEVSFTTLYEVGLTVPWFTDCETRKKSYLNRMASACNKQTRKNIPLRQGHITVHHSSTWRVRGLPIHPGHGIGHCPSTWISNSRDIVNPYLKNLVLILLLTMM